MAQPHLTAPVCRLCGAELDRTFLDLGVMPPANALLGSPEDVAAERALPLQALACDGCGLVQVPENLGQAEIFTEYAYFSSYSDTFLAHARAFARRTHEALGLGGSSLVVEAASNDGYLLRHFSDLGVPVLGIEPARNVAAVAEAAGVPTDARFLTLDVGREIGPRADLVVANNVLGHVPDLHDFVGGLAALLAPRGVLSVEVHHLLSLVEGLQFDTIYHEHRSYFSLATATRALGLAGLEVFDAERIPTHGGSLRLWAARAGGGRTPTPAIDEIARLEDAAGVADPAVHAAFGGQARACRDALRAFLDGAAADGRVVAAYGAAAKGATLLNWAGASPATVRCVADRNPHKQDRLMPGTHIPTVAPEALDALRPDHVVVLPWNLADEIAGQLRRVGDWGGTLVVPVPRLEVRAP